MSPRFASDDIDEVRDRADIVEVISEHVRLKKAGRSYKGLCPFHQEKTPSFSVDPDKGVYYCFGCSSGGSVFTFLEQTEGLSFPEAVESLARRYNVELREVAGAKRAPSAKARLYALQEATVEKYRAQLSEPDAEPVRAYLASRGITDEQIERHQIGFGGWRRDVLVRSMLRRGFKGEELMAGGLATRDGRAMRDMFFARVVFPIFDPSGRPVGFGGRVLPDGHRPDGAPDGPKYLNSRASKVFDKSKLFYGTNWARSAVMKRKRLAVVEGYTDVIALHAAGVEEAVATCGTSLTEEHMKEVSTRFGDVKVVLCLDADAAGQAAMARERTEELAGAYSPGEMGRTGWLPVGKGWLPEVHVAHLPAGQDPADFVRIEGAEAVQRVLDGSVPLAAFLLERALEGADPSTPEGRARAVRRGVAVLTQVGDSLLRHEYALWLADKTGVDTIEVTRALESASTSQRPARRRDDRSGAPVALSGHHRVEREALRVLLADDVLFNVELSPGEDDFSLPVHRSLFRLASGDRTEHGSLDVARLVNRVQDDEVRRLLSELSMAQAVTEAIALDTFRRLKGFTLERHIVERKQRLRTLDPEQEPTTYDALFEELLRLEKEKRALKDAS